MNIHFTFTIRAGAHKAPALIVQMMAIIDPLAYKDRLTMPKLVIDSCGDEFFMVTLFCVISKICVYLLVVQVCLFCSLMITTTGGISLFPARRTF